MSQTNLIGFVGFGVPASSLTPSYFIEIPEDKTGSVCFVEDPVDGMQTEHATIDRHAWSVIAFALRAEFGRRLKANGLPGSKWVVGENHIENTLGSEALCLLCAVARRPNNVRAILEGWLLLLPHERLWLSAQARSSSAWRAGIAVALAGDGSAEDCWRTAA